MAEVDSDEDLTKELQPLAYHVSDRKRVLREAFRSLKGKRLDAMIPPSLKSWDRPKLESACLAILENLDDETLLAVLDGRAGTAGVSAVEQISTAKESSAKEKNHKSKKLKLIGDGFAEATDEEVPKKKRKKKATTADDDEVEIKAAKLKKKKKLAKAKLKEKSKKKKAKAAAAAAASAEGGETGAAAPHKSLMELLELEYRAKAIKALLRSQGQSVPEIPIDLEEDEDQETEKPAEQVHGVQVNGTVEPPKSTAKPSKSTASSSKSKVLPTSKKTSTKLKEKVAETVKPKSTSALDKTAKLKPTTLSGTVVGTLKSAKPHASQVSKSKSVVKKSTPDSNPKDTVVDLIHEALNTSIPEVVDTDVKPLTPPSVIADALVCENKNEEDLRSKLLKRYQQKKETAPPAPPPSISLKKRKKKKPELEIKEQEEDILDLHPPELSLTDEDRAVEHTAGNESSEYESASESENEEVRSEGKDQLSAVSNETSQQSMPEENVSDKAEDDEELDYNEDDEISDEEVEENIQNDSDNESKNKNLGKEDSDGNTSEVNEDKLWEVVQEMKEDDQNVRDVDENVEAESQEGCDIDDNEETSYLDESDGEKKDNDEPLSENSRSGVFSETTRDDVFESAKSPTDGKSSTGATVAFNTQTQSLKRKITFRIDPARIGVLEEQAVEEEAKRAEERKRQEEEERLAREAEEPEEGEIDSNEEEQMLKETETKRKRDRWGKSKSKSRSRSPSSSPTRPLSHPRNDDLDSDDSEESTSYYARKRSRTKKSKRSPSPTKRDFGRYSPKRPHTSNVSPEKIQKEDPPKKRSSSPVEFITQFSDMESISDDDSNHSQSSVKRKLGPSKETANLPVHGCASMPKNHDEEEKKKESDRNDESSSEKPSTSGIQEDEKEDSENEQEEDELPKPVTWYERWAQSRGIQKVVRANKIHKKVRTKLKQVKTNTKSKQEVPKEPEPSLEAEPIIGSIEEYEKLFGKKVVVNDGAGDNSKSNEDSGSGNLQENNDEDDADDLWGDIIGGSGSE